MGIDSQKSLYFHSMNFIVSLLLSGFLSIVKVNSSPKNDVHFHIDLAQGTEDNKMNPTVIEDGNDYAEDDIETDEDIEDTTSEDEEDIASEEDVEDQREEYGTDYASSKTKNKLKKKRNKLPEECRNLKWNLDHPEMGELFKKLKKKHC